MGVHRDAAPVVAHGEKIAGREGDFDEGGMAGDGFVHRIVDDFGGQMMQRVFVGPADIHPGAAADGFEAFEDFDVLGGIGIALACREGSGRGLVVTDAGLGVLGGGAEEIVHAVFPFWRSL